MTGSDWRPNEAQMAAVAHIHGPLRIQAGAGSGKTTTLVRRILALLAGGHATPEQVLMLTYTNKAVGDMRQKVAQALPDSSHQPRIETYHAFALSLVQEYAHLLGLPPDPVLLTEGPARLFCRRHLDRLGITALDLRRTDDAAKKALSFFGSYRYHGAYRIPMDDLMERLGPEDDRDQIQELVAAHDVYRALLREAGAADYDDLIALAVELLEQHPGAREAVAQRYRFVLLDEYQDTDYLQAQFIRLLVQDHGNVTIVGDPDQTIYSFRGAALSNILSFHEGFPDVKDIHMVINYRSTPAIVTAANQVIRHNVRRKEAELQADREQGGLPRPLLVNASDFPSEARWLAQEMLRLHEDGVPWGDMAVLVRKNESKAPLYQAMVQAGIPVQVVGGLDLISDPETARFIAFLRALSAPEQDADLSVAMSLPRYGLTDQAMADIAGQREPGERLIDTLGRLSAGAPRMRAFLDEFWPLYQVQHSMGWEAAMRGALALHRKSMSRQARLNAEQLVVLAEEFLPNAGLFADTADTPVSDLALFCQYLDALRELNESPEAVQFFSDKDAVSLMTVHAAKGLEFPVVFLPRLNDRDFHLKGKKGSKPLFPAAWHHDPEFAENAAQMEAEEQRRLFYVAVTRARDRLYLSWAPVDPNRKRPLGPSQFVAEIQDACDVLDLQKAGAVGVPEAESPSLGPGALEALLGQMVSTRPAPPPPKEPTTPFRPQVPAVFSFSHLNTYQLCPYRFYLEYLVRVPGRPVPAAEVGIRVHGAIEQAGRALAQGQPVTYSEFAAWAAAPPVPEDGDVFGPALPQEPAEVEPEWEDLSLETALHHFWESEYAKLPPIAVEQEFYVTLGDAVVRGFIDRIHRRQDGTVEVVDFKTYNRLLSEAEVRQGLQLPIYIKACREVLGCPVDTGVLYFLKQNQAVRVTYTDEELAQRWQEAQRLITMARAGEWAPTPGKACGFCPFGETCPSASSAIFR